MTKAIINMAILAIVLVLISGGFTFSLKPFRFTLKNPWYSFGFLEMVIGLVMCMYGQKKAGYQEGIDSIVELLKENQKEDKK